jgi:AAA domain-containing protein
MDGKKTPYQTPADDIGNTNSPADGAKLQMNCDESLVNSGTNATPAIPPAYKLDRYSLRGRSADLKKELQEQRFVLPDIALHGQSTVIYGQPGAGKTLLTLHSLKTAIQKGDVDPHDVFYINCDDNAVGLAEKVEFAEMYGFHMIAPGYLGFRIQDFQSLMSELSRRGGASESILIVDTAKKVVDIQDKGNARRFGIVAREFVSLGGSLILLAHTNKHPGSDGRPIFAGTSDLLEDCDCGHILRIISDDEGYRAVEFENKKHRGLVAERIGFKYCTSKDQSYFDLLASVTPLNESETEELKMANDEFAPADTKLVHAAISCIADGITSKTTLVAEVRTRTGCSRRQAERVIEHYTGSDPNQHHWRFTRGARGLTTYTLLPKAGDVVDLDDGEACS